METNQANTQATASSSTYSEFLPGTAVIYGAHGKCSIQAVELKKLGDQWMRLYKLEVTKPTLSRSTKQEPAIWVPVDAATSKGLRLPITAQTAQTLLDTILSDKENYFSLGESWSTLQHKLEACIRKEGAVGLAKVYAHLYTLKRKQVITITEITRYTESISKHFLRELSEATNQSIRSIEEKLTKTLRNKPVFDN